MERTPHEHLEITTDNLASTSEQFFDGKEAQLEASKSGKSNSSASYRLSKYYFEGPSSSGSQLTEKANFSNTSHFPVGLPKPVEQESFNQVPQRFSQFLIDQNSFSDKNKHLPANSQQLPKHTPGPSYIRDISDLMGSQATIFSTKEAETQARLKQRGLLTRQKAVKYKQGTVLYRLRKRLRRFAARVANFPKKAFRFVVRRKGTRRAQVGQSFVQKRNSLKRNRSTMLKKSISGPITNPNLGKPAERVAGIPPEMKRMATEKELALQLRQLQIVEHQKMKDFARSLSGSPADSKKSHLSRYISEQLQLHAHKPREPYQATIQESSKGPTPPPHRVSRSAALTPTTPPHRGVSLENQMLKTAWRRYLTNVLAQRIQLRQEIHMFQSLLAGSSMPDVPEIASSYRGSFTDAEATHTRHSSAAKPLPPIDSDTQSLVSVSDSILSDSDAASLPDEVSDSDFEEDPQVTKFTNALNRRSVLGEMLDYNSDDESVSSRELSERSEKSDSVQVSRANSQMLKRYGTVRKTAMTPPPAATPSSKYLSDQESPRKMPRSAAVHQNLNLVLAD